MGKKAFYNKDHTEILILTCIELTNYIMYPPQEKSQPRETTQHYAAEKARRQTCSTMRSPAEFMYPPPSCLKELSQLKSVQTNMSTVSFNTFQCSAVHSQVNNFPHIIMIMVKF